MEVEEWSKVSGSHLLPLPANQSSSSKMGNKGLIPTSVPSNGNNSSQKGRSASQTPVDVTITPTVGRTHPSNLHIASNIGNVEENSLNNPLVSNLNESAFTSENVEGPFDVNEEQGDNPDSMNITPRLNLPPSAAKGNTIIDQRKLLFTKLNNVSSKLPKSS